MIGNFHLQNGKVEFRWRRWRNKKRQEVASCLMVLLSGGGVAVARADGDKVTSGQGSIADGGATDLLHWSDRDGRFQTAQSLGSGDQLRDRRRALDPAGGAERLGAGLHPEQRRAPGVTFTGTSRGVHDG